MKNSVIPLIVIVLLICSCNEHQEQSDFATKQIQIEEWLKKYFDSISSEFNNYKIANIGDMLEHIAKFEAIWKSSLGEEGFKNFKQTMETLNDPDYVKRIVPIFNDSEKGPILIQYMKKNIPEETHDIFDEMFPAALAAKNFNSSDSTIRKSEEKTIFTIDKNGNVVDSKFFFDEEGNLIEKDIRTNTQSDVKD